VFHPRASNPELWRTSLPLAVRVRCGRHKGLIATWVAIHWLIVLHAASGRRAFGVRDIADEARVGRNELTGPTGYLQRLVALDLVRIVGYEPVPGMREPRPIYHIDLAALEAESLALTPSVLREYGQPPPPRPAPDPRQLTLFDPPVQESGPPPLAASTATADAAGLRDSRPDAWPDAGDAADAARLHLHAHGPDATHARGTAAPPPAAYAAEPGHRAAAYATAAPSTERSTSAGSARTPDIGTGACAAPTAMHGIGTDARASNGPAPATRTGLPANEPAPGLSSVTVPATGTVAHADGPAMRVLVPDHARNRDVEGGREREKEGGSQLAHADLLTLAAAAARQAIHEFLQHPTSSLAHAGPSLPCPAPPPGEPTLPAAPLALWGADREHVADRDRFQLDQLAAQADLVTAGYGAYWLGRAILLAEACLEPRQLRPTMGYLRGMLRRWQREGRWGSDLDEPEALGATPPPRPPQAAPVIPEACRDHPAVRAYVDALHETPNAVQAAQIAASVTDLDRWRQVLTDWQLNGWGERSVGKMLDRYQKGGAGASAASSDTVSAAPIHTHPGLSDAQRDRLIRRFRAASPAAQRALLAQLDQEHPR